MLTSLPKMKENAGIARRTSVSVRGRRTALKPLAKIKGNRKCHDADVARVVRDPLKDDRILVESRAEIVFVPHEPSESEKHET